MKNLWEFINIFLINKKYLKNAIKIGNYLNFHTLK